MNCSRCDRPVLYSADLCDQCERGIVSFGYRLITYHTETHALADTKRPADFSWKVLA